MVPMVSKSEKGAVAFAAPSLEQSTVETRLMTGVATTGGSRGSLSKVAGRYQGFLKSFFPSEDSSPSDADGIEISKQELERELQLYAVELHKWILAHDSGEAELLSLDRSLESLRTEVSQTREEISALRQEQQRTKQVRSNKEEFESLAKLANHRQPRHMLEQKLQTLQQETHQFQQQDKEAQTEVEIREKQLQLLLQCMMDLKASVSNMDQGEEEEEEEEGAVPMDTS